ncbi:MAG TPA: hypothetical protein VIL03_02910 [Clostridia bacterium]|jgi:hypothetical protein
MEFAKKVNSLIDKIPVYLGVIMLGVGIIFSSLYDSQDKIMLFYMMSWGQIGRSAEIFGWWFYIFLGLVNLAIFELAMRVIVYFVRLQLPIINRETTYHYTRVTFSVCYLILGAFHISYFFFPLLQVWGALFDFIVSALFLYMTYYLLSRRLLPNFLWARALKAVASIFFFYHGISTAIGLFAAFGGLL